MKSERIARADTASLWAGVLLGIGVAGTLDGVILHEFLQWHNFYVHTTRFWRIFIDGAFHLFSGAMLLLGALRLWALRGRIGQACGRALAAGIFLGAGGFNLYDGTIQHKVLRLHPVRERVPNQLPYDLAFNAVALLLLLAGWLLWRGRARRTE